MERKEYSAGMVKLSFWFAEFRKVIQLLNQGKALQEIRQLNLEENIFSAPTKARAIQVFNTVSTRVKGLAPSFYPLFEKSDISTQKLIVLIAVMQSDSLFFDFIYEVYREKLILGNHELTDSDFRIFFNDKQRQSEKVAHWTDGTLKNLKKAYKGILGEAGLINRTTGNRHILRPIIDKTLEAGLIANGMELTLRALTGVR